MKGGRECYHQHESKLFCALDMAGQRHSCATGIIGSVHYEYVCVVKKGHPRTQVAPKLRRAFGSTSYSPETILLHAGLIRWRRRPMLELRVEQSVRRPTAARPPAAAAQIAGTAQTEALLGAGSGHAPGGAADGDQNHADACVGGRERERQSN